MDFTNNAFGSKEIEIPADTEIVWVSDLFVDDYVGGAELTSEALIKSSPFKVFKLHSKNVSMELLEKGQNCYWVFGNFSQMDLQLIPAIVVNMKYSVVEYDYKYCKYRSPEKHENTEGTPCDCEQHGHGKLIAALYQGAQHMWWMSEKQQDFYFDKFPALSEGQNTVLSSVFDDRTFAEIKVLREKNKDVERKGWIVLGSQSWVKGYEDAVKYCEENQLDYEVVWNLPYETVLDKISRAKGHVYLPRGKDTCPRMIIESKLLGCELVLNENVQHKDEDWFNPEPDEDDETTQIEQYLYAAREWFWNGVKADINYVPSLSGYTTTRNCIDQKYPFVASISSMLDFCDEVVVVDNGSTDGTLEKLQEWAEKEEKLKVYKSEFDWEHKRFAVFDGMSKALAREYCTKDFCWQQDSDEVVHEADVPKIKDLLKKFPANVNLLALPVVEYWGGKDKVRMDINPWKWRVSRNRKEITHGVPGNLRVADDGEGDSYYSRMGSDGCDYINRETLELIPFGNFYTSDVEMVKRQGLQDPNAKEAYENWFKQVIEHLPSVYHYSWWDIERKIKTYKNYWQRHWESLFNLQMEDTAENNNFFGKPWSEVSDEEITEKAKELAEKTGGWIFHSLYKGEQVPHITLEKDMPKYIKDWVS